MEYVKIPGDTYYGFFAAKINFNITMEIVEKVKVVLWILHTN
jgi:hypothetical protein